MCRAADSCSDQYVDVENRSVAGRQRLLRYRCGSLSAGAGPCASAQPLRPARASHGTIFFCFLWQGSHRFPIGFFGFYGWKLSDLIAVLYLFIFLSVGSKAFHARSTLRTNRSRLDMNIKQDIFEEQHANSW
jgi:hypothetical protein